MRINRSALVISGKDDPMWPFLQKTCSEEEKRSLILFSTSEPQLNQCAYNPVKGTVDFTIKDEVISGDTISGIWWRRIPPPNLQNLSPDLADYCIKEQLQFLEGLEYILPDVRWVSKPSAIVKAQNKAWQISLAKKLGFKTLDTIFTNSPQTARIFASKLQAIYKAIRSPRIPLHDDKYSTVFTTLVTEDHYEKIEGILTCPGILQEFCQKVSDIRVTVMVDSVFAVEIKSQDGERSKLDFRMGARHLPHLVHKLPPPIRDTCIALVKNMDLNFGAIDLALMEDGSYVFFEINPNGQWGWLEQKTGIPIRKALLDYLFYQ